jgi:O-glycosyl hydrolase
MASTTTTIVTDNEDEKEKHHDNNNHHRHDETTPLMMTKNSNSTDDSLRGYTGSDPTKSKYKWIIIIFSICITIIIGSIYTVQNPNWWLPNTKHDQNPQPEQTVIVIPDYESTGTTTTDTSTTNQKYQNHNNNNEELNKGDEEITVNDDDDELHEPEILIDKVPYRAICEYYSKNYKSSSSSSGTYSNTYSPPVRIIQTSLHEANQPWSMVQPCIVHPPNTPVQINIANTPDAILHVNFTTTTTTTTTRSSSTKTSSSSTSSSSSSTKLNKRSMPTILGFGGAFTEATTLNFQRLSYVGQQTVLELLFGISGLGYSMGRIPIHSCDFSIQSYTFDNVVDDLQLNYFDTSLSHDSHTIQFVIRAIQTYHNAWRDDNIVGGDINSINDNQNHTFRIIASPWSPPSWMKRPTWEDMKNATYASKMTYSAQPNCLRDGVHSKSKYAKVWAQYISKYISSYQSLINTTFYGITVQNEPEFAAPWEACSYTALNMTDFVAYHLGPIIKEEHPNVHILAFDHNKDHINQWMLTMLNTTKNSTTTAQHQSSSSKKKYRSDATVTTSATTTISNETNTLSTSSMLASKYISGTAYHWYAGGKNFFPPFHYHVFQNDD